jgi:ATP-dependent Clp protease ATP-binding subunit ClpA
MMGVGVEPTPDSGSDSDSDSDSGGPTFTGRAQDAIDLARREADRRGKADVGTEHILLALVEERDGAAVRILQQLDADPATIRAALSS